MKHDEPSARRHPTASGELVSAKADHFLSSLVSSIIGDPLLARFDSDTLALVAERMWAGVSELAERKRTGEGEYTTAALSQWLADDEDLAAVPPAILALIVSPMLAHLNKALV